MKKVFLIHGYNGIPLIFRWLKENLENLNYSVFMPTFPIQENALYNNWEKQLSPLKNEIMQNSIVIAHSIGNEFVIKYFTKNHLNINLFISLAGFSEYFEVENRKSLNYAFKNFLVSEKELENFKNRCSKKYSIYSDNDHLIPFAVLEKFPQSINATPIMIKNIGHMGKKSGLKELPEILKIIEHNS